MCVNIHVSVLCRYLDINCSPAVMPLFILVILGSCFGFILVSDYIKLSLTK